MRNRILLAVFFIAVAVMFVVYFVPQIDKANNIDVLETSLHQAKRHLPESAEVYFFQENLVTGPPEIYYKTQLALAPRIVISTTPDKVPPGSYVLLVKDKSNPNAAPADALPAGYFQTLVATDAVFQIKLLKKL